MRTPMLRTVGSGSSSVISRCALLTGAALVAVAVVVSGGCEEKRAAAPIHSLADLNSPDMIIGGETETVSLRMGAEALPKAKVNSYATPLDAYAALAAGKIDAVAYDRPPLEYAAAQNPDFIVIPDVVGEGHIAVGAPFKNRELMERVNEFIKQYKEDGTYDDMYNRWVKTLNPAMPTDIPVPENPINKGNPLVIGNDPQNIPMSFQEANGDWSGFDTEFVMRLAAYLNMEYRFESLYYDALFPAVESEKLDLAVGNLDKTPERAETMLFSDDYIDCPAGIMVLKSRWQPEGNAEPVAEEPADVDVSDWSRNPEEAAEEAPAVEETVVEEVAEPAEEAPKAEEPAAEAEEAPATEEVAEPAEEAPKAEEPVAEADNAPAADEPAEAASDAPAADKPADVADEPAAPAQDAPADEPKAE